ARENIQVAIRNTLSERLEPSSSPLSFQKAAALFQACVYFASQDQYETYHLIEWMLSLNLDLFNETRLATVNPVEMIVRGSLDLGVEAVISITLSDQQFHDSKRMIWIEYSNEAQQWFALNATVNYNELLLRHYGAEPPVVSRLAVKLYGYDMQHKTIARSALAEGRIFRFLRIRNLGLHTKPYVTEDDWANFFTNYTNGTYKGTDEIVYGSEITTILSSLLKSKSVGKDGLRYLVAWSFYRQLLWYTEPEILRHIRPAATVCYDQVMRAMGLAAISPYFTSALPPRMVYRTKRIASRIRNSFESALNSSSWIGQDVRDEFMKKLITMKIHFGLTGRRSDPAFVEEIYTAYSRVTEIILTDQRHPVTAYLSPAGITSRGVIRGVGTDFDDAALNCMLMQPRNPGLLGARRIKNTATVILIFSGLKVPNYVYCGQVIYRCTLYKRQIDTCRNCGQVGHRQDLCPTPSAKCVLYAAKHTARATANADIATRYLTWCAAVVSAVADESKPNSKHPPQDPARFLPRLPNLTDLSQAHELLPPPPP
ncbi:hypothetical protein MTO96_000057, partial [Rhipicephalus appendiculatus]